MTKPVGIRNRKNEVWKFIGTKYLLSNYGRWYSLSWKRIMKQHKNSSGYYRVKIDGKQTFTHIKVVELFGDVNGQNLAHIESLFDHGLSIDHINKNKRHNMSSNLELVTHKENCLRKFRKEDNKNG
jgi:hypothetical protein